MNVLVTLDVDDRAALGDLIGLAAKALSRPAPEPSGEKPDPARPLSDMLPNTVGTGRTSSGYYVYFGGPLVYVTTMGDEDRNLAATIFLADSFRIARALRSIVEGTTPGASVTGEARSELVKLLCRAGVPCKV